MGSTKNSPGCACCNTTECLIESEEYDKYIVEPTQVKTYIKTTEDGATTYTDSTQAKILYRDETVDGVVTLIESITALLVPVHYFPWSDCEDSSVRMAVNFVSPAEAWNEFGSYDYVRVRGYTLGETSLPATYDDAVSMADAGNSQYLQVTSSPANGYLLDTLDRPTSEQDYILLFISNDDRSSDNVAVNVEDILYGADASVPDIRAEFTDPRTKMKVLDGSGTVLPDVYPYYLNPSNRLRLEKPLDADETVTIEFGSEFIHSETDQAHGVIGDVDFTSTLSQTQNEFTYYDGSFVDIAGCFVYGVERTGVIVTSLDRRSVEWGSPSQSKDFDDFYDSSQFIEGESVYDYTTSSCGSNSIGHISVRKVFDDGEFNVFAEAASIKVADPGDGSQVSVSYKFIAGGDIPDEGYTRTFSIFDANGSRTETVVFTNTAREKTVSVVVSDSSPNASINGPAFGQVQMIPAIDTNEGLAPASTIYHSRSGSINAQFFRQGIANTATVSIDGGTLTASPGTGIVSASLGVSSPGTFSTSARQLGQTLTATIREGLVEVPGGINGATGTTMDPVPVATNPVGQKLEVYLTGTETAKVQGWSWNEFKTEDPCSKEVNHDDCPPSMLCHVAPHSHQQYTATVAIPGITFSAAPEHQYDGCESVIVYKTGETTYEYPVGLAAFDEFSRNRTYSKEVYGPLMPVTNHNALHYCDDPYLVTCTNTFDNGQTATYVEPLAGEYAYGCQADPVITDFTCASSYSGENCLTSYTRTNVWRCWLEGDAEQLAEGTLTIIGGSDECVDRVFGGDDVTFNYPDYMQATVISRVGKESDSVISSAIDWVPGFNVQEGDRVYANDLRYLGGGGVYEIQADDRLEYMKQLKLAALRNQPESWDVDDFAVMVTAGTEYWYEWTTEWINQIPYQLYDFSVYAEGTTPYNIPGISYDYGGVEVLEPLALGNGLGTAQSGSNGDDAGWRLFEVSEYYYLDFEWFCNYSGGTIEVLFGNTVKQTYNGAGGMSAYSPSTRLLVPPQTAVNFRLSGSRAGDTTVANITLTEVPNSYWRIQEGETEFTQQPSNGFVAAAEEYSISATLRLRYFSQEDRSETVIATEPNFSGCEAAFFERLGVTEKQRIGCYHVRMDGETAGSIYGCYDTDGGAPVGPTASCPALPSTIDVSDQYPSPGFFTSYDIGLNEATGYSLTFVEKHCCDGEALGDPFTLSGYVAEFSDEWDKMLNADGDQDETVHSWWTYDMFEGILLIDPTVYQLSWPKQWYPCWEGDNGPTVVLNGTDASGDVLGRRARSTQAAAGDYYYSPPGPFGGGIYGGEVHVTYSADEINLSAISVTLTPQSQWSY